MRGRRTAGQEACPVQDHRAGANGGHPRGSLTGLPDIVHEPRVIHRLAAAQPTRNENDIQRGGVVEAVIRDDVQPAERSHGAGLVSDRNDTPLGIELSEHAEHLVGTDRVKLFEVGVKDDAGRFSHFRHNLHLLVGP